MKPDFRIAGFAAMALFATACTAEPTPTPPAVTTTTIADGAPALEAAQVVVGNLRRLVAGNACDLVPRQVVDEVATPPMRLITPGAYCKWDAKGASVSIALDYAIPLLETSRDPDARPGRGLSIVGNSAWEHNRGNGCEAYVAVSSDPKSAPLYVVVDIRNSSMTQTDACKAVHRVAETALNNLPRP